MNKTNGSFCNQLFLVGVDKRFMIDRRIGFLFVQHHAAISTNDGSGMFQNDQTLVDGLVPVVSKYCAKFFNRAFTLLLQILQNGGLTLTRFHGRDYLDLGFKMITSQASNIHNEIIHVFSLKRPIVDAARTQLS